MLLNLFYATFFSSVIYIVAPAGQTSDGNQPRRVFGGKDALPFAHPYQVSIQYAVLVWHFHNCGGAILTAKWVVTASHCVDNWWFMLTPPFVVAGQLHRNDAGEHVQQRLCSRKIPNPDHRDGMGPNDIGLLELSWPLKWNPSVAPVRLPRASTTAEALATGQLVLVGWGSISATEWPQLAKHLQTIVLEAISYEECISQLSSWPNVRELVHPQSNICTRGPISCSADSGSPVVLIVPGHEPVLFALVSWGLNPCGVAKVPSIHTNVSNFIGFIDEHVGPISLNS